MRTFTLNSREFYEAVTEPRDPSAWGPQLPRVREREPLREEDICAISERREGTLGPH